MKRLLLVGFAACAFALAPSLTASAMPIQKQSMGIVAADSDFIQVHGDRGGRGHHYGWGRGRGHHHGWGRGHGHGRH